MSKKLMNMVVKQISKDILKDRINKNIQELKKTMKKGDFKV